MEYAWQAGQCTVRDVHEHIQQHRELAYTTVMTVMGRLAEKGLFEREQHGNSYVYRPTLSREAYQERVVSEVLDALLVTHGTQTVSHLVKRLGQADVDKLDELEEMIRSRRGKSP
jgi:predicted transcriptional regulator